MMPDRLCKALPYIIPALVCLVLGLFLGVTS